MVAGLYLDRQTEIGVFIRKNRPIFMKGRLNLPGGHIEDGETPNQAMAREFKEEVGVDTLPSDWEHTITLKDEMGEWEVEFFLAFGDSSIATTMTDEQVERYDAWNVPTDAIPNLRWIIPLSMDRFAAKPVEIVDRRQ